MMDELMLMIRLRSWRCCSKREETQRMDSFRSITEFLFFSMENKGNNGSEKYDGNIKMAAHLKMGVKKRFYWSMHIMKNKTSLI